MSILARLAVALVAGALFGFGLSVSDMVNPARVLAFLNVTGGAWDPTLAFVLAGAIAAAIPGILQQRRLARPLTGGDFGLPETRKVDARLVGGAAMFGLGWGLAGFCPGPALAALSLGTVEVAVFVAAMAAGMVLFAFTAGRRAG
ncbi:YeeE/YedE family protein [Acuticoccus sp. MNP-M23]|uniref:DUF6691 family protein n=1 Tax=Acuticoccus sp. MNP-M23 TaxID=3072793 RepID=UPI002815FEF9|nr:DUF6691 family protein [Acuticoccus sp. MNP-M23]WMS42715.1 YeeE/YedE family protein [Acuticoccus sp. MNP-M23]